MDNEFGLPDGRDIRWPRRDGKQGRQRRRSGMLSVLLESKARQLLPDPACVLHVLQGSHNHFLVQACMDNR